MSVADVGETVWGAGEDDDLTVLAALAQDRSHALEPGRVGVTEGVVENKRDSFLSIDEPRTGQAENEAHLLLCSDAELIKGEDDAVEGAVGD